MQWNRRQIVSAAAALAGCSREPAAAEAPVAVPEGPPLMTRKIPSTGQAIPIVGLGTWQAFDISPGGEEWAQAGEALRVFAERGGSVVDSSPMYGKAEEAVGALAAERRLRPRLFLATKVWTRGREAGVAQMEASRAKLRAEVIDLMQVHNLLDLDVHMPTLREWKAQGKIRYIGITHSNERAYDALEAAMRKHAPLDFIQINASVAERESEARILPLARDSGMAVLVNRPFAAGDLFDRVRRLPLPAVAKDIGAASWAQLMLKYVLANPAATCAIPRTRNPRYVLDNLGAAVGALPTEAQRRQIVEAVSAS